MELRKIISELENKLRAGMQTEDTGHDIYHLIRTCNLALHIQKIEGGDPVIVGISAFLHDMHRIIQHETGKYCSPFDSLPRIKDILDGIDISTAQKDKILHCIRYH
ncbi:MAG: hypothetical protein K9N06_01435 [Candidatus Cloacimonetes bacterium]|nr:hypothetical protein [Candidatus Cloacimonadota bacterium]